MDREGVEFRSVSFAHRGRPVLAEVSLAVAPGSVAAIVGRSGTGKTTLLKLANRLYLPDAGTVLVAGQDTRTWNPISLRRRMGYVIQDAGLLPHLSVDQNVGLVPRLEGWPVDRRRRRVHELLDLVGLPPSLFASRMPRELSGGQRQRVALARALAIDPPILLMDEPFGALDVVTRAELHAEFTRLQRDLKTTVILVTHDLAEAARLSHRIGVLHEGRLVAWDSPAAVLRSVDPRIRPLVAAAEDASLRAPHATPDLLD